jgi:nucleoside-diphosphate-sugar epimerase
MHVCVIGGTGHISTSIVRVLLAQGHAVTGCNRGRRGAVAPNAVDLRHSLMRAFCIKAFIH